MILERFDNPKPVGSGLILQPTGLTVLDDLGLYDAIMCLGARIVRLHGSDVNTGGTVLDVRYDALKGGRFGLGVHRAALFGVLYRAVLAEGIEIETGVDLSEMEASTGAASLTDATGRKWSDFDLVVDASGTGSRLRRHVTAASDPKPLPYGAFWGSLKWPGRPFEPTELSQRYDKASVMIGVLPIGKSEPGGDDMAALFWSLKPDDAQAVKAAGISAWKTRLLCYWPECEPLLQQIESFDQLTLARYGHHTLVLPVGRRLAVIGDAAHSASPQLGQGANMALLDARALAHGLVTSPDIESGLAAYAKARRFHMRVFQALSYAFTPFYQSDSALLPWVRDRIVPSLARIPPGPQFLASMVSGTVVDPFKSVGLQEKDWMSWDKSI